MLKPSQLPCLSFARTHRPTRPGVFIGVRFGNSGSSKLPCHCLKHAATGCMRTGTQFFTEVVRLSGLHVVIVSSMPSLSKLLCKWKLRHPHFPQRMHASKSER